MPKLMVRCSKCQQLMPTGVSMNQDGAETIGQNTSRCSNCGHIQSWSGKDVDPSSFDQKKK